MKIKKIISVLAATSILGTSIVTPLNIISTEAFASVTTQSVGANPNLLNLNFDKATETTSFKLKNWITGTATNNIKANTPTFTQSGNKYSTSDGKTIQVNSPTEIALVNTSGKYFMVGQYINTEIGKEYTISSKYTNPNPNATSNYFWMGVQSSADVINDSKFTAASGTAEHTFTATESQTLVFIQQVVTTTGAKTLTLSDFSTAKSNYQMAKEGVSAMFETDGKVKTTVDQAWIDEVQGQINLVTDATKKQALQTELNKAKQKVADDITKSNNAKTAVDALFVNNTSSSDSIKDTTTQAAIDNAKNLVSQVTDPVVKLALENDIAEAQNLLDAKNAAIQAEKDRQDAASKAVKELFTNDDTSSNSIKNLTDQTAIDAAKALVDKVTDPTVKTALEQDITKAQNLLDAKNAAIQAEKDRQDAASKAVKELFTNDDTSSNSIKNLTDQTAIDAAKALVDKVTDPTVKTALQQDITKAQNLLDAKNAAIQAEKDRQDAASKAVKELFTNDDTSSNSIKNLTDQTAIDAAKALVDKVTDPTVKTALEQDITKAQNLLDAKNAAIQAEKDRQDAASKAVKELFTNDDTSSNSIKNLTDQTAIDAAKALVDKVTDPTVKAALQQDITKAQNLLDAKNAAIQAEKDRQDAASKAVKELFTNDDTSSDTIKNTTSQSTIDDAKSLVNTVTDPTVKATLEQDIAKAQSILDAQNAALQAESTVKALFNNDDTKGTIKNTTDQAAIDAAQQLVNSVIDPAKKSELQQAVNKAQRQLALGEVTIDTYTIGGNYITGTTKTGVTKVGIYVDGKLIRTAAASNGTYQIYASTAPELQVTGQAFEVAPIATDGTIGLKSNSVVSAKVAPKKIAKPMIDDYFKGTSYITGTVSSEAKKIALYIDGQFVRYGAVTGDTFKIYASDVALMKTEGQTFEVVAVDNLGNEGERASSDVKSKTVKGNVLPNETTTLSTYNTGTVTGDVHMIALYVDGKFVRYGAVTGTDYKVYIYDVPALRIAGTTFEVKALDTAGNILYTSTQIVQ
ncbi:hypothetical protein BMT55_03085 [Listeria newyorkensis]|uniref:Uncharacterized protein n=4 Tax=Listeria newyorkensis TaxID=1497681 RepID=A0ABX4XQI6_9LIST|nr:toxin Cry1Ac domain D-VI-related protein [Listeria newyorkensis]PNP94486.1 hypothetical protein BMT55_03085 [Listeria newyorkensis]WAO22898.1 toxin Cry1Ac domain D-VI-related protein [Listeria newyorkensis]SQC58767.1 ECM-binding protein homolog [Listeria newyorkensis]